MRWVCMVLLLVWVCGAQAQFFVSKQERNRFIGLGSVMYVSGVARGVEQVLNYKSKKIV